MENVILAIGVVQLAQELEPQPTQIVPPVLIHNTSSMEEHLASLAHHVQVRIVLGSDVMDNMTLTLLSPTNPLNVLTTTSSLRDLIIKLSVLLPTQDLTVSQFKEPTILLVHHVLQDTSSQEQLAINAPLPAHNVTIPTIMSFAKHVLLATI